MKKKLQHIRILYVDGVFHSSFLSSANSFDEKFKVDKTNQTKRADQQSKKAYSESIVQKFYQNEAVLPKKQKERRNEKRKTKLPENVKTLFTVLIQNWLVRLVQTDSFSKFCFALFCLLFLWRKLQCRPNLLRQWAPISITMYYSFYLLCIIDYYFHFRCFYFLFPDSHFITSRDTYSCNRQTSFSLFFFMSIFLLCLCFVFI